MGSLFKQSSILKFSNKTCLVNILFFRKTFSNFSRLVFNTLFSCSWGHPSRTYAIFCKKNDPPHPLIRTCTFCNTPPPPPPPPIAFFYVKSNFSFKILSDLGMQLIPKNYTLFNFFLCTSHIYNKTMFYK